MKECIVKRQKKRKKWLNWGQMTEEEQRAAGGDVDALVEDRGGLPFRGGARAPS